MPDDLVTWLREAASRHNNYRCDEAADRIEQLEKTLRLAAGYISAQVDHWHDKNPHDVLAWLVECAEADIRAALGEKKDD